MFVSSTQFFLITPILPQIERQFCVPAPWLGTIVAVYSVSLGLSALLAGFWSDKLGRRNILMFGSSLMSLSLLLHGLAFNFGSLLIVRLLAGVAGGVLTGSCISYVRDYFPYERRGRINGAVITAGAVGQILGLPLGILLAEEFGVASPFVFLGVLMAVAFFLIHRWLPFVFGNRADKKEPLGMGFWKVYRQLLRQTSYQRACLAYMLMYFSFTVYMVYFPKWLAVTKSATSSDLAFLFLVGGSATLVAGPLAGWLADRVGRTPVTIATNLAASGAMGMSLFFRLDIVSASFVFFAVMLFMSGRSVSFQSMISDATCDRNRGKTMNLLISVGQLGMAGGSVLAGFIFSRLGFEINTIVAGFTSLLMILLVGKSFSFVIPTKEVEPLQGSKRPFQEVLEKV